MVVDADNKAAYREVTLGRVGRRPAHRDERPQAGERIVVNGLQRVRPGALVAPQVVAHGRPRPVHAQTSPAASDSVQR